jgi:hypothetical protein
MFDFGLHLLPRCTRPLCSCCVAGTAPHAVTLPPCLPVDYPSCLRVMCSPVHKAGIGLVDPNKGISIRWVGAWRGWMVGVCGRQSGQLQGGEGKGRAWEA